MLGAIGLVLIETIALQLGPILTQIGIDDGVREQDQSVIVTVALVYVAAVMVAALLGWARVSYTGRLGERLNETLRIRVFSHMQRQGVRLLHRGEGGGAAYPHDLRHRGALGPVPRASSTCSCRSSPCW